MTDPRDDAIARMNAVIDNLKADFLVEFDRQLAALRADVPLLRSPDDAERNAALERLKRLVHELRGMAETFGFPLVNQAATSLYLALNLDFSGAGRTKALSCVDAHMDAVSYLAQREKDGHGGDEEKIMVQSLEQTVAHLTID